MRRLTKTQHYIHNKIRLITIDFIRINDEGIDLSEEDSGNIGEEEVIDSDSQPAPFTDNDNDNDEPDNESTYAEEDMEDEDDEDSDSETPYQSQPVGERESDHDGDQESGDRGRGRRIRRRIGRVDSRNEGRGERERERGGVDPRAEPSGAGEDAVPGGEDGVPPAEGANDQPAAAAPAEEAEVEQPSGPRGSIGNGWWFLAMLLVVQLYQSGMRH